MTELKIPVEELSAVLNKAILDSLTAETRERLIEGALKYLMTAEPDRTRYNAGKSPLQVAFEQALNQIAHKVASEVLESAGAHQRLTTNFGDLIDTIPDFGEDEKLQAYMLNAVLQRAKELKGIHY